MGLYENIKKLAELRGITISAMEKDLGFARSSIQKFNSSSPNIEKIKKIAEYLDVSIDDIIYGTVTEDGHWVRHYRDDETARLAEELLSSPATRMLFDAAKSSKPEDVLFVAEMLRRLKKGE